jgi:hypothetical protein
MHDVGVENCHVDTQPANRLQRYFGAQLRLPANLEQAVTLLDRSILG